MLDFPDTPVDGEQSTQPNGITYVWQAAKTRWVSVVTAGGGIVAGTVVQVKDFQTGAVASGVGVIPSDNTIPQITEGDEYMSIDFTPKYADSVLQIDVLMQCSNTLTTVNLMMALFKDSDVNALIAGYQTESGTANALHTLSLSFSGPITNNDPRTYSVRAGGSGASTFTFNGGDSVGKLGGAMISSIIVTEIQPEAVTVSGSNDFDDKLAGYLDTGVHGSYTGDLNSILTNSYYSFLPDSVTNEPAGMPNSTNFVETHMATSAAGKQYIYGRGSSNAFKQWERELLSGVWGAWKMVVDGSAAEGTWSPVLSDSGNNDAVQSVSWGEWKRDGRMVTFWGQITCTSVAGITGTVRIKDLPFVSAAAGGTARYAISFSRGTGLSLPAPGTYITGSMLESDSHFILREWDVAAGETAFNDSSLTNTANFAFSGSYMTDDA